ncbi:hypothetical protein [Chromobacterium amazonense]|uniref:hypothetical protein n=1 Tax=Chromobacterium amazonense TaxID=1382803 RepID=UPI0021B748DC|nr:hypothetical protein [Chromobacterium amazonense]
MTIIVRINGGGSLVKDIEQLLQDSMANMAAALQEIQRLNGRVGELENTEQRFTQLLEQHEESGLSSTPLTPADRDEENDDPERQGGKKRPRPELHQLAELEYPGFSEIGAEPTTSAQQIEQGAAAALAAELEDMTTAAGPALSAEEAAELASELNQPAPASAGPVDEWQPSIKIRIEKAPGEYHEFDLNELAASNGVKMDPRTALDLMAETSQLMKGGDVHLSVDGQRVGWQVEIGTKSARDPEGELNPDHLQRTIAGYDNVIVTKSFADSYLANQWLQPNEQHETASGESRANDLEVSAGFIAGVASSWNLQDVAQADDMDVGM